MSRAEPAPALESAPRGRTRPIAGRGFTLAELLVSLLVSVMVMTAVVFIFQVHNTVARTQTQVAEMQQSLRVAQFDLVRNVRMAGRGGIPERLLPNDPFAGRLLPNGMAIEVDNNVAANTRIGDSNSPLVVEGSDVLTIRGVFESPIYQVDPVTVNVSPTGGSAVINYLSPAGVQQNLDPIKKALEDAGDAAKRDAIVLVSPLAGDVYAIGEISGGNWAVSQGEGVQTVVIQATVNFVFTGGTRTNAYADLMTDGAVPGNMRTAAFFGVLEEYRYYLRADREVSGDAGSPLLPRLSRARYYPGTDTPHASNPTQQEDIADQVWDFQLALGIDSNNDGTVAEGTGSARSSDEWLFNHPNDTTSDPSETPTSWVWNSSATVRRPLSYLRVNTLVRSDRRQLNHVADPIVAIEDRAYDEDATPADDDEALLRSYRRRLLQTTVDLRNL